MPEISQSRLQKVEKLLQVLRSAFPRCTYCTHPLHEGDLRQCADDSCHCSSEHRIARTYYAEVRWAEIYETYRELTP